MLEHAKSLQSCPTLCDPMDYSQTCASIHGIFQARVMEWVVISFTRGSSRPRDWTQVSHIVGRCFTVWATREVLRAKTLRHQAPPSLGFSRQEHWSGLPFPSPCTLKTSFFPFHPQVDKAMITPFTSREFRVIFSIHWTYLVGKVPTDTITGEKLRLVSFKFN